MLKSMVAITGSFLLVGCGAGNVAFVNSDIHITKIFQGSDCSSRIATESQGVGTGDVNVEVVSRSGDADAASTLVRALSANDECKTTKQNE